MAQLAAHMSSLDASRAQSQAMQSNPSAKPVPGVLPRPAPGVADVKPRLTKEQHDILETHFQQQHKPSTNTKKGFADQLGVPLDKINNWFQNRRAKVKQDIKKQMNQYNMSMGVYGPTPQMPVVTSQFGARNDGVLAHPQPSMTRDFYAPNADISPTCNPVQSVERPPPSLELGSQLPMHQPYDMRALGSIPEADRNTAYHPNAVMQSFMAATAGASYLQNHAPSVPQQDPSFSFSHGLPYSYSGDLALSVPNTIPPEPATTNETFNNFSDFGALDYSTLAGANAPGSNEAHNGGAASSEPSPFSGAQSNMTTQSSGPGTSSVTSIASMFSGWTDDQNLSSDLNANSDLDDVFKPPYNMPDAALSDHSLFWGAPSQGGFPQHGLYQHTNASAQAILSSPSQSDGRKSSMAHSSLEAPTGDDIYLRRNSSTTNLASNIEAIHIQNSHTPDDFSQSTRSTSIAARRQQRPAALNSSTLRSASYTSGMSSPGSNSDHHLRRIKSSGIGNGGGRVQKNNPGSAQRSPMAQAFADFSSSPKFARAFSASSSTTLGGGSLAPPTPLTPGESSRVSFPSWQSNHTVRNSQSFTDHGSPESLHVGSWSAAPESTGMFSNGASPSSTAMDNTQLSQTRSVSDGVYRDTPPQSAPATQQAFPRPAFVNPPPMRAAYHSTTDLTLAQPKPSHFRRPSLPDGPVSHNEHHMQASMRLEDFQYDDRFGDMSLNGITHNVPFAPPACMPEFLVHEFSPPQGGGPAGMYRRTADPQPKSYIFANQGPGDFRS